MIICLSVIIIAGPIGTKIMAFIKLDINNINRYYELIDYLKYSKGIVNFDDRIETIKFTVGNIIQHPFGYGFGFLYQNYRIDESIMYSALLNGTGLIGFIGFMLMIGQLYHHFIISITNKCSILHRELATLGIATLTCGLLIGVSSDCVILYPIHSFVFWAILAACYSGTCSVQHSIA
jgi:hypothetical protein